MKKTASFLTLILPLGLLAQLGGPPAPGGGQPAPQGGPAQGQPVGAPGSNPPPANGGANNGGGLDNRGSQTGLGKSLPFLDPASGTLSWDGYNVNVMNNPVFRARFEKYLAAPAANDQEDESYRQIIQEILDLLSPTRAGGPDFPKAFSLLKLASQYDIDAGLCDSMSNDIWAVWQSRKNTQYLERAITEMKSNQKRLAYNNEIALASKGLQGGAQPANTQGGGARSNRQQPQQNQQNQPPPQQNQQNQQNPNTAQQPTAQQPSIIQSRGETDGMSNQDISLNYGRVATYISEIGELEAKIRGNQTAIAASSITIKLEYQAKVVQHFIQRRFEHTIMACRFYRNIFNDGDNKLYIKEGSDVEKMFSTGLGMAPTIGTLDGWSNEAIRDVDEGVQAFETLLQRGELTSATEQLAQAFLIGEYLPRVRRLPVEKKSMVLQYVRDTNQLISAIEVKDYTLADELIERLRKVAKDFDYSKPRAAVETARTVSGMHINSAKIAALNGENSKVEEEMRKATELWPTNPALKELTEMFTQTNDIKAQALIDFDRLLSQKDYRQIFMDQGRYAGAVIGDAARQGQLAEVLKIMNEITITLSGSRAASERGDVWAAYEMVERIYQNYGDDPEVSRMRSDLTRGASEFVNALSKAEDFEKRDQVGAGLTWYLKAKNMYDGSSFAREGIDRLLLKVRGHRDSYATQDPAATNTVINPIPANNFPPATTAGTEDTNPFAPPPQQTPPTTAPATTQGPANGLPLTNPQP